MTCITHAIIPTAGFGTRMLPLSKAVPKELLPLGAKPVIHYVVMEAIRAGLKNIVLVNHAQKSSIEDYFDLNAALDDTLRAKGKHEQADVLQFLPADVQVVSVRQSRPLGLGHAVLQAKAVVGNNPFAVLLPDVVLDPTNADYQTDNLAYMLKQYTHTQHSQVLVQTVADSDVHKYGIAKLNSQDTTDAMTAKDVNRAFDVLGFVEKPSLATAPSRLAAVGRYVFDPIMFECLADTKPSIGGEIQLTDAIHRIIGYKGMQVVTLKGTSFDAGDMATYMDAFVYFASQQVCL